MSHTYPHKETPTEYEIHPLISKRWSGKLFTSTPIEEDKIMSLFEAMRWAASSFNEQPWRVVYATQGDTAEFETLSSLLMSGNKYATEAYILLLVFAQQNLSRNNEPNYYAQHDVGMATQNLMLQAVDMDLLVHPMGGFDKQAALDKLDVPDNFQPMTMLAVGYAGDYATAEETGLDKPRQRKSIDEFVYRGKWKT